MIVKKKITIILVTDNRKRLKLITVNNRLVTALDCPSPLASEFARRGKTWEPASLAVPRRG